MSAKMSPHQAKIVRKNNLTASFLKETPFLNAIKTLFKRPRSGLK